MRIRSDAGGVECASSCQCCIGAGRSSGAVTVGKGKAMRPFSGPEPVNGAGRLRPPQPLLFQGFIPIEIREDGLGTRCEAQRIFRIISDLSKPINHLGVEPGRRMMRGTGEPTQHLLIIGWRTHKTFFPVTRPSFLTSPWPHAMRNEYEIIPNFLP